MIKSFIKKSIAEETEVYETNCEKLNELLGGGIKFGSLVYTSGLFNKLSHLFGNENYKVCKFFDDYMLSQYAVISKNDKKISIYNFIPEEIMMLGEVHPKEIILVNLELNYQERQERGIKLPNFDLIILSTGLSMLVKDSQGATIGHWLQ